ncbi:MAG: Ig-like domain-containing protein [Actinomycetota bacterium]|nr:Ig-like domain-containing protein [Actinomycetota bacterium]
MTRALQGGSGAIDAADDALAPAKNQRGTVRLQGPAADIGAFEVDVAPTVTKATPTGTAKARANVVAVFSKPMDPTTITGSTFTLKKGAQAVRARVSLDPTGKKVTLNPRKDLQAGAKYTAAVATAAKDLWGTALDQDPNTTGD